MAKKKQYLLLLPDSLCLRLQQNKSSRNQKKLNKSKTKDCNAWSNASQQLQWRQHLLLRLLLQCSGEPHALPPLLFSGALRLLLHWHLRPSTSRFRIRPCRPILLPSPSSPTDPFASISTIRSTTPINSSASSGDKIGRIVDALPSPSASATTSPSTSSTPSPSAAPAPTKPYDRNFNSTVVLAQSPSFPSTSSSVVSPSPRSKRRCVDFKQSRSDHAQSGFDHARSRSDPANYANDESERER